MGCLGNLLERFFKYILMALNFILLFAGLAIAIIAALVRWGNSIKALESLVSITTLQIFSLVLLIVGVFLIIMSVIGLLGFYFKNRLLLYIYIVIIGLLFLVQFTSMIVLVAGKPQIKEAINKELNKTVTYLNSSAYTNTSTEFVKECSKLYVIADFMKCCGYNSSKDFFDTNTVRYCCNNNTRDGCQRKLTEFIDNDSKKFLVVPFAILLVVEIVAMSIIIILIGRFRKQSAADDAPAVSFNARSINNYS